MENRRDSNSDSFAFTRQLNRDIFTMKSGQKAWLYGLVAGAGILLVYLSVLTVFQSYGFALYEFKRLWMWLVPLAIGFGGQVGLYISLRDKSMKTGAATSGAISGGSMIACCSHYALTVIPLIGITSASTVTTFLMTYQKAFFSIGIASSIVGIALMLHNRRKMKGGSC